MIFASRIAEGVSHYFARRAFNQRVSDGMAQWNNGYDVMLPLVADPSLLEAIAALAPIDTHRYPLRSDMSKRLYDFTDELFIVPGFGLTVKRTVVDHELKTGETVHIGPPTFFRDIG